MKISLKKIPAKDVAADALILPFFEEEFADFYSEIDEATGKIISKIIGSKDFTGKHGRTALVPVDGIGAARLLLVGLGKADEITPERLRRAGAKAFAAISDCSCSRIALSAGVFDKPAGKNFSSGAAFYFLEGGLLGSYRYEKYKTAASGEKTRKEADTVTVLNAGEGLDVDWLQAVVSATFFSRDMVNAPANDMTPTAIAGIAKETAGGKLRVRVLESREMEKEKMGAYLSVSKGSDEPLKFIIMEYKNGKGNPVVLIGKTVTFDSGGLDIKPGSGMEEMKDDMTGGSVVLAVIRAAAALKLPLNLVAILPAVENLIGGSASRPGDVVATITGKTVEIISTDAEGRMTLADAIGYAVKYMSPEAIIDIATLTGACNIAFGNEAIAMMGNNAQLMDKLRAASEEVYERVWPMPLFEEYGDYLKSDIADIKNVGGRKGSLCSSAYFLKDFAGSVPWAHLDIAGASWNETNRPYSPKGASGIGVRLLLNFIRGL
jgi:leucyl aminopeptidase